jgi:hypothetical protein
MTVSPRTVTSRRSVLRAAAIGSAAVAVTPVVLTVAEAATAAPPAAVAASGGMRKLALRPRKRKACKRSQVRFKGRCMPKEKARKKQQAVAPTTSPATSPPAGTPTSASTPTSTMDGEPGAGPLPPFTLLSPADRHLTTRFSYGVTARLAAAVTSAGGAAAWFEHQLTTGGVGDPGTDGMLGWWPSLSRSAPDLWTRQSDGVEGGYEVMSDYQRYLLLRRMYSTRPVLDVMTEFWENHLNVPVNGDPAFVYRASYGVAVRANALGRYDDLLIAAVTHPAMLLFLDAAVSTAAHPNENLGRELLELHTVGLGRYSEEDVKTSARILTGYHVDRWNTWAFTYRPSDHWVGPVKVLDFTDANANADGRATIAAYLRYLARHPATAQRIARKLAVKFVSDAPPQSLVDLLARTYLDNDTAIVPVLRALVASPAFQDSVLKKVRDPGEDVVATYLALGIDVAAPASPRADNSGEQVMVWQCAGLGAMPHAWPRPDGAPIDNASWSSPARIVSSLDLHMTLSGGWWPSTGVSYLTPAQWLPAEAVRFDDLVEHLCNRMLHLTTPPGVLVACSQAVGEAADAVITANHPLVKWSFPRLLSTVLDTPHHLKR